VRRAFYRIANRLSEDALPVDAGDFRLVDRKIIRVLEQMPDANPYLRGAIAAMGFEQVGVPYDRAGRERGETKFSVGQLFGLAIDGILNHSIIPLRVATFVGIAISLLTLLCTCGYAAGRILWGSEWPPGYATTVVLILAGISLNALFLGVIGEYLGRIYKQVKRGPLTVIEASLEPTERTPDGTSDDGSPDESRRVVMAEVGDT